jgi:hypothetical protein
VARPSGPCSHRQAARATFAHNPTIEDRLQYNADLTFARIADASTRGSCPSVNGSTTCFLTVDFALSTDGGPNYGIATKSITLKLLNARFSELAVASGINVPVTPLQVSYSSDNEGGTSAKVYTPALFGGATWTYDFVIINPPMNNGNVSLNLVLGAQLVPTGLIGHTYYLQGEIQLPGS